VLFSNLERKCSCQLYYLNFKIKFYLRAKRNLTAICRRPAGHMLCRPVVKELNTKGIMKRKRG
jgi:hypothetical protein